MRGNSGTRAGTRAHGGRPMSDDPEPRTVKARVSDPELLAALEDAEESQSMASVVRDGLRATLLNDDESTGDSGLSPTARKGYQALRKRADGEGIIELSVAESAAAQATNVKKDRMRSAVFEPLRRAGRISVMQGVSSVSIRVLSPTDRQGVPADD